MVPCVKERGVVLAAVPVLGPPLWPRFLKLYYLGLDAKPSVVAVCESDLRDNVNTMASYINGVKSRSLTAHFQ